MNNLTVLIERWKNSALEFRETERLITLLILDNERLEKENNVLNDTIRRIYLP